MDNFVLSKFYFYFILGLTACFCHLFVYFENINNIAFFLWKVIFSVHIYDRNCKNKTFKTLYKFIFYNTNVILFVLFLFACFSMLKYLLLILNAYYY